MNKAVISILATAALPLSACTSTANDDTLASAGTGAAIGAAGGAGVSAIAGGDLLTGALVGAAVGGLAGAVWADQNNDGVADGYVYNGQYYEGAPTQSAAVAPQNCPPIGSSAGAGSSAAIGAPVGGISGAVWTDANNDGCVDGYIRDGQYYSGGPVVQSVPVSYTGERG